MDGTTRRRRWWVGAAVATAGAALAFWAVAVHEWGPALESVAVWPADPHVVQLGFSPDGRSLVVGSGEGPVTLRSVPGLQPVRSLTLQIDPPDVPHSRPVFATDGRVVIVGRFMGRAGPQVLDAADGRLLGRLGDPTDVRSAAFTAGGDLVVVGKSSPPEVALGVDFTVRTYDPATWQPRPGRSWTVPAWTMPPVMAPDGVTVAVSDYGRSEVTVRDLAAGADVATLTGQSGGRILRLVSVAFRPDGKALAAGGGDGSVWVWELPSGRLKGVFGGKAGTFDDVVHLAYTPDGRQLVAESRVPSGAGASWVGTANLYLQRVGLTIPYRPTPEPTRIRVIDAATGRLVARGRGTPFFPATPAVSPDGRYLATGEGLAVHLWRLPRGEK